jgi:hypothetical protein
MVEGWISFHRKIWGHWLIEKNRPLTRFEAWLKILSEVNNNSAKVSIGNEVYKVDRGESLNSLDTWARLFNWNKSKVRRFLKLLESDSMVVVKSERKTTRLTVCKYDDYQSKRNANETQVKRKRNASETQMTPNNKENKENKYTYSKFYDEEIVKSDNNKKYLAFVNFLFKTNPTGKPLSKVINMANQISFEQLNKLLTIHETSIVKDKILALENTTKKYKSFTLTLNNWLNGRK